MSLPKATSLFHFTKSIDVLESIVVNGFYPKLCLEDVAWMGTEFALFITIPMVSFCAIPISRIANHVDFYGEYGIGLSQEWALKNGLNPIFYLSPSARVATSFNSAIVNAVDTDRELRKEQDQIATEHLHFMWAHAKPLSGKMHVGGEMVEKDFYLENEWRYVPKVEGHPILRRRESWDDDDDREKINLELQQKAALSFVPSDIRYIFVKDDADIPRLVDCINTRLSKFPLADLKILTTRITSLEHIQKDM